MTPLDLYAKARVLEAIYGLWKDEENTADRPVAAVERITQAACPKSANNGFTRQNRGHEVQSGISKRKITFN
jgi:hypothetical protein